jgi:ElaB/YqjD/DUF883 family membrane-anchored ribosome-binding protein
MKLNGGRSRDEILAEVESVRSDMDSTLSAIERKLTPGQLVDQGLEYLRNSGAREFFSNLGTSVKQNPIPVALVGVSIAWLMASGRTRTDTDGNHTRSTGDMFRRSTDAAWSGARSGTQQARRTLNDATQAARERFEQARQSVSGTAQSAREGFDHARQAVSSTMQSAREGLGQARQTVSDTVQSARDALSTGAGAAQRQFERARGGYDWMVREQPLALGAIGLAIGALLATAAPRTRVEDEWMGEASDRLADRAKEAGREQLDRASDALRSATSPHDGGGTQQAPSAQGDGGGTRHSENPQASGQVTSEPGTEGLASERGESTHERPGGRPRE